MFARLAIATLIATAGALPVSPSTASITKSDDLLSSIAANLTSAITASNNVQYAVSIDVPGHRSQSMDCMMIMKDTDSSLIAVFHAAGGGDKVGDHQMNALYLARANVTTPGDVPGTDDWVFQTKLSARGSMGYLKEIENSEAIFLAYELERPEGNRVALRLYKSKHHLLRNEWVREVQMNNELKGAGHKQGDRLVKAQNMGTPSISSIVELEGRYSLSVQFHYYITSDIPGEGIIDFPQEGGGVVSDNYPWWEAKFSEDANNAIRIANAIGKIGQRALLHPSYAKDDTFLLYEAQMAEAGEDDCGWLSWRLFLHQHGKEGGAVRLNLSMPDHLQTFANPHANVVGDWIYFGFFIPSQPFRPGMAESYTQCNGKTSTATADQGKVTVKCETCADEPMQKAEHPANFGSMLLSVKVSDIFG